MEIGKELGQEVSDDKEGLIRLGSADFCNILQEDERM